MLYKRPGSPFFYIQKTRQSTKTSNRKLAEEMARKVLNDAWRFEQLGEARKEWADLCEHWKDIKGDKKSANLDAQIMDDLGQLIRTRKLSLLQSIVESDVLAEYLKRTKNRTSASTANRHLHTIKAMFKRAHKKEWITKEPNLESYKVTEKARETLSPEQFDAICSRLTPLDANIARIALLTGMRRENVCGLQWEWINPDMTVITVPASYTKAQRTYTALVPAEAKALLESIKSESAYVFADGKGSYRNGAAFGVAFRRASARAGFKAHVHQLRHTWASAHIQNDTPDRILMAIGGWASPAMLGRYVHIKTGKLLQYAENSPGAKKAG